MMLRKDMVENQAEMEVKAPTALIGLAGQPNVGKSTLFNLLTGLNQHVGNWPGKTIEHREGFCKIGEREARLVDLPGTYSLTANSPEELVAREFVIREQPDVLIAMVSAASLEQSLYLVSELICLPAPLVIALNMVDVAKQEGILVEPDVLQAAIGVPVVPVIAARAVGVRELVAVVDQVLRGEVLVTPNLPDIRADHRDVQREVFRLIRDFVPEPYPADWSAMKLLEGDEEMTGLIRPLLPPENRARLDRLLGQHEDAMLAIASGRYEWIGRMIRAAVVNPGLGRISLTDRIDKIATHPQLGVLVLAGILGLVFWLTFSLGAPIQKWMETRLIAWMVETTAQVLAPAPSWVSGLFTDGVLGGVGTVLTFVPIMVIFFTCFGLLEDIGYMTRAAYVMDNFMHMMGLHGTSFLPLFLGFGCNVPAVMGTRVIESRSARLLTILIAPLVPCMARMGVVAFIAPAFFGAQATLVSWGLILLSLILLVLVGIVLSKLVFRGEQSAFIMEMPLYHIPNGRTIFMLVWHRTISFVQKAGTVILAFSVVVWALSTLPHGEMQTSFMAQLGHLLAPVGRWMGLDWRLSVALLSSFLAKENAIATLGVLFSNAEGSGLADAMAAVYPPASGLAFLTVTMLFIPCAATLSVIRTETGSRAWPLVSVIIMLALSTLSGVVVFHLATALGMGA